MLEQYHLFYIGKPHHPETEAVLSFSSHITLITENTSYPNFSNDTKLALAHQTTMSDYDVEAVYNSILAKFPNVTVLPMVCNATKKRQMELTETLAKFNTANTLFIIVGDKKSNNCLKLYELAKRHTNHTLFIESWKELSNLNFANYIQFIISSGTSTPIAVVNEIANYIKTQKTPKKELSLESYIKVL